MRKFQKLFIFVALIMVCAVSVAMAKEYKVSLNKLEAFLVDATPGDIYIIRDGVYKDIKVKILAVGNELNPVIIRSENPGRILITGKSQIVISGSYVVLDGFYFKDTHNANILAFIKAQHCRLTNTVFSNCGNPKSAASHIVRILETSKYNLIDHCMMIGNLSIGMGVLFSPTDHENVGNIFEYNYYLCIRRKSSNGQECLQIGQDYYSFNYLAKTIVRFCYFQCIYADAEIISCKTSGNIFQHNTFRSCFGGLVLRGGNNSSVESNYFFDTSTGVRVHGAGHKIINNYFEDVDWAINLPAGNNVGNNFGTHHATMNSLVAHNTVVNSKEASLSLGHNYNWKNYNVFPANNKIVNNIFYNSEKFTIINKGSDKNFYRNNILWPSNYKLYNLNLLGRTFIIKNPYLKKVDSLYILSSPLSSAINNSYYINNVKDDILGKSRDDNMADVGCYEYSFNFKNYKPLTENTVGTNWYVKRKGQNKCCN